jgi:hypothetical protein
VVREDLDAALARDPLELADERLRPQVRVAGVEARAG